MELLSVSEIEEEHGDIAEFAKKSRKSVRLAKREYSKKFYERLHQVRKQREERLLTRAEVALHNRSNDAFVIIDGVVYNVTTFLEFHPGGSKILLGYAGKDATTVFEDMGHSLAARFQLADLYWGDLPLIEQVNFSDSDSDTSDTDEDRQGKPALKLSNTRQSEEIVTQNTSPGTEFSETRPDPLVRRIVPNRYRRPLDGNESNTSAHENNLREKIEPPRVRAAHDWKFLLRWRVFKNLAPILLSQAARYSVLVVKRLPAVLAYRSVQFWNRYAHLILLIIIICLLWYMCYTVDSEFLWTRLSATKTDGSFPYGAGSGRGSQNQMDTGAFDNEDQAPPEHDPNAILYF